MSLGDQRFEDAVRPLTITAQQVSTARDVIATHAVDQAEFARFIDMIRPAVHPQPSPTTGRRALPRKGLEA